MFHCHGDFLYSTVYQKSLLKCDQILLSSYRVLLLKNCFASGPRTEVSEPLLIDPFFLGLLAELLETTSIYFSFHANDPS